MIVFECDSRDGIDLSARRAVEAAHQCGFSIQLSYCGLRTAVGRNDDPREVADRWRAMYEPKAKAPEIKVADLDALRYERDAAVQAYEAISISESSARAENIRLTQENGEQSNVIGVHQETIATQSKLIARLRSAIDDLRKQNTQYHDESTGLRESYDRVHKANHVLLNQLIDYDAAASGLLANVARHVGMSTVVETSLDALQAAYRRQQAVRIHPESTEAANG